MREADEFEIYPEGREMVIALRAGDVTVRATITQERLVQIRDAFARHQVNLNAENARLQKLMGQPVNRHERRKAARAQR